MTINDRISRLPRAFEPDRGREARTLVPALDGDTARLVDGAAGCAPYLAGLIRVEAAWLATALDAPEAARDAVLGAIPELAPDALGAGLRQAKRRIALLAGLCDLGGVWTLEDVTRALSDLADAATHAALVACVGAEIRRGKLPGATEADATQAGGMVALAMGKHGAHELNYSSDIDLICLFDETRFEPGDRMEARASFIRATRKAMALLSDLTGDGYVFRTDLRLRPDPSVTPVCFAMDAAERYYESVGRTWERAAYVKARACAGDIGAGERFLKALTPFVWRKHLDFAAIDDAHDMRLRIREHKGLGGPLVLEGHNMKLGLGGIREIEFFTQTRQIIAGGRDPDLRVRGTVDGLSVLARKGWIEAHVAATLTDDYRAHREVEHRLQMLRDAQTHSLPTNDEEFERLAAFMGTEVAPMRAQIAERCERVHEMTEGFFAPSGAAPAPKLSDALKATVVKWSSYPALRSKRAQEVFDRLKPELLGRLVALDNAEEVAGHLDGFLAGLPAGVQLFTMFDANPRLVDLILDIASTAPELARYLGRNSQVLDAVIGGDFFAPWPGVDDLTAALGRALEAASDYEACLDAARRWAKEWHFRIGVHHLRGLISADEAGAEYADLARASLRALYPAVVTEFARKHGAPPGNGAMVLGMGSLGAARLTAASDLDMIVIYDAPGEAMSEGRRPLGARAYYARLTQALITAMTAQTAEGRLYEVDMRLRPSGRQGPVATSFGSFQSYQREEAWVWEHLALTRGSVVAGDAAVCAEVEAFRAELLQGPHERDRILHETAQMRMRLAEAKPGSQWDPKNGPGRLMDIELLAEAGALLQGCTSSDIYDQLAAAQTAGMVNATERAILCETYRLMWRLQSAARLLSGEALSPDAVGSGGRAFLLRATAQDSIDGLAAHISASARMAAAIVDRVLPAPPAEPKATP